MDTNWATEHLQTIRTLMERSALYRRALAPISTFVGVVGIMAAFVGRYLIVQKDGPFALYWMGVGVVALGGALLLVRRQAGSQGESFWSPPMRRVAQAMAPALLVGLMFGFLTVAFLWRKSDLREPLYLVITWTLLYGLALHSAGFFMPRGIRLFGWGFILAGMVLILIFPALDDFTQILHWWMGLLFGASHLAYGVYLYFTEQRKNEA